jgi:predicted nucleotidyltransferase component of viral defense system
MGTETSIDFSPERKLHVDIMRAIAKDFHDIPMVLKGGTALLLCYGLDRFSEDLDFDAPKKFNISNRVERILSRHAISYDVKTVKDTATVQRIKSHYYGVVGDRLLKIETSFRQAPNEEQTTIIDGIRTYTISTLIEQKIEALINRTAARDLYDVAFLARSYFKDFSEEAKEKLAVLMYDVNGIEQRFQEAFEEDEIMDAELLPSLILQITEALAQ